MTYPRLWNAEHVHALFTTESRQKARDIFLTTHRPLRRIRVDFCKEPDGAEMFIDEEQLREIVQSGRLDADNRLFFIVGEAGCGKSELCQWLEYAADTRRSIPIHIPRSMTSAAGVLRLLRERLGTSSGGKLTHVPTNTQADYIALSAVMLLYERGNATLAPANIWAPLLMGSGMRQAIETYLQRVGADAQITAVLDAPDVARLCTDVGIVVQPERLSTVVDALCQLVTQSIEQALWLGDLRGLLTEISGQAVKQGRRPLLLIEDITAFQTLGDVLLDYLLDLTSGHFDAVIGVTTGFEHTQLAGASLAGDLTHIHHRLRARFVLTDDHGRTYWLEEEMLDLARTYIRAARRPGEASVEYDAIFGESLYPFTATMLSRAFDGLHEEGNSRQTPRLLLEHVLAAALLADDLPSLALDRSTYVLRPPNMFRTEEAIGEKLQSLLRWYGEIEDKVIVLDPRIPALWNVPIPDSLLQNGRLEIARSYVATSPHVAPTADWQRELRELQQWLEHGGIYPSRETLKRGIERMLLGLGDPRALGSRNSLSLSRAEVYYARGDERLPIFLDQGSGDQPSTSTSVKVRVSGSADERVILEELAYLALSGAEPTSVCQNLALTLEWSQGLWDEYHAEVQLLLTERLGLPIEHLVLVTWRMLCALYGVPWELNPHVQAWDTQMTSYDNVSPWSSQQHPSCYSAGKSLTQWHETTRRLFIGMFMLRDTLVDQERVKDALLKIDHVAVIHHLASLPLRPLRALPFKIRPGNQPLYEWVAALQRYAQGMSQFDVDAAVRADLIDLGWRERYLASQIGLDSDILRQQLEMLRWRAGQIGVIWREGYDESLAALGAINESELRRLQAGLHALAETTHAAHQEPHFDVWAYQQFRHKARPLVQHSYWRALAAVQDIQRELLKVGRARYRRSGRRITGTRTYGALLRTVRQVRQELADE